MPDKDTADLRAEYSLRAPVAFLVFNRPDASARVFRAIAKARPAKLLIIADGPRDDCPDDAPACAAVREIAANVDWDCEVLRNYAETNLGCRKRVASGLDWVFATVEEAIILEDDCLPIPGFFRFCDELLERYRHEDRLMSISGTNMTPGLSTGSESYFAAWNNAIWGWATWRRAWSAFDLTMTGWPAFRDSGGVERIVTDAKALKMYRDQFQAMYEGRIDTWDYAWRYACWSHGAMTIIPAKNLVSNIGFGADALHTKDEFDPLANLPAEDPEFPLAHPEDLAPFTAADRAVDRKLTRGLFERVWRKARRVIKRQGT